MTILVEAPKYRRDFCGNCGSPVPSPFTDGNLNMAPAGTLDTNIRADYRRVAPFVNNRH